MGDIVVSGEGVKWVLDSATNDQVIQLSTGEQAQNRTLHKTDGTNYQVPAGKKFVGLSVTVVSGWTTLSAVRLIDATVLDSGTGTGVFPSEQTINTVANQNAVCVMPAYFEIPATHYLNMNQGSGFSVCIVIGVETDV
jgi:hypothetical protein